MEKQQELLNRVTKYVLDLGLRCPPYTIYGLFHHVKLTLEYYEGNEIIEFMVINGEIVVKKLD
jgi:hypothetical protein